MNDQDDQWSKAASYYEKEFVDPFLADVRHNSLQKCINKLGDRKTKVAADLGCGIGPLLPSLAKAFRKVYAIDFAAGMLERAKEQVKRRKNVNFVQANLTQLPNLPEPWDVAFSVNSLVMPYVADQEQCLREIYRCLKPGGYFIGIVPAMDAIHYFTMLLVDRALAAGKPIEQARKNAAHLADHALYDFAFSQARYDGLEQHFWHPFEIRYRFKRAGFRLKRLHKVSLSWSQFLSLPELKDYPPPWDWFFLARKPMK